MGAHPGTLRPRAPSALGLRLYALQRWLLRLVLLGVAVLLLGVALVTRDKRTLPGLRIVGVPLGRTTDPLPILPARGDGNDKVRDHKAHLTTATRGAGRDARRRVMAARAAVTAATLSTM